MTRKNRILLGSALGVLGIISALLSLAIAEIGFLLIGVGLFFVAAFTLPKP